MIKSLIEEYSTWLITHREPSQIQETDALIRQLKEAESIGELQKVLVKASLAYSPTFFTSSPVDTPDIFIRKLAEILRVVSQLMTACANMKDNFSTIERLSSTKEQTKDLIFLLKKIILEPRSYLYTHLLSLTAILLKGHETLQGVVNHLEAQPPKTIREGRPRAGSFDAMTAVDAQHQAGIDLLRNNSATYSGTCKESEIANHLLQNLLILYQAVYAPVINQSRCTIS